MERFKKIVVLIPSYNEGNKIINILQKLKKYNTIVVDDGSTDKTHLRVNKLCTHFLRNKKNIGYQKSIEKGLKFAIKNSYDGVVTFDADGQLNTSYLKTFFKHLKKGYDLVIGIRNYVPRISEKIFNVYTSRKFDVKDILCGLKGYNLKTINKEVLDQDYNACSNIALDYIKNKKNIRKVSIKIKKRNGDSKFGNFFLGNIKIFRDLFKEISS
tara:strand:+ start:602 stop:1240 length:639 start_codon:yes stop_codon:yes gene_type:complete